MYEEIVIIELALWFGLPAWIANAVPVLVGGGRPIDGGRLFNDGRRIFGDGKTVRGFIAGVAAGVLSGGAQGYLAPFVKEVLEQFVLVTVEMEFILFMTVPTSIALSTGALMGDLVGSFVKRRVNIKSGGPAPVMDQLGFIIVALIFAAPFVRLRAPYIIVLLCFTLFVHYISNVGGYLLGWKKHPW